MKREKKRILIILIAAFLLLSPQSLSYAQTETEAQVEFSEGEGPTRPVHPDYPEIESNEDGVKGSLVIVRVSDFNFGSIPITPTAGLYNIDITKPNIQVVDLRGVGTGWRVSAQVSDFSDGKNKSLPGAAILIHNGHPNSLSNSDAPTPMQSLRLTTDNEIYPVITANAGAGTGLWIMRWYPPGEGVYIQLEVPAGSATKGSHKAIINWILENTPSE